MTYGAVNTKILKLFFLHISNFFINEMTVYHCQVFDLTKIPAVNSQHFKDKFNNISGAIWTRRNHSARRISAARWR